MTAAPQRTCIGCRKKWPKGGLVRLVRGTDGRVVVDDDGRAEGRGAYVCLDPSCLGKALNPGRLGHAFKRPSEPPALGAAAILNGRVGNDKARR
ncbi:MAG TPA: YlxR family protein [Candidatus Bathyarchaeia archaeon]|nr:YlxR family protein [Candidatus Bathyarchaeia archaeon]